MDEHVLNELTDNEVRVRLQEMCDEAYRLDWELSNLKAAHIGLRETNQSLVEQNRELRGYIKEMQAHMQTLERKLRRRDE